MSVYIYEVTTFVRSICVNSFANVKILSNYCKSDRIYFEVKKLFCMFASSNKNSNSLKCSNMKAVTLKHACAYEFFGNNGCLFVMRGRTYKFVEVIYSCVSSERKDTLCVYMDFVSGEYKVLNVDTKRGESLITII